LSDPEESMRPPLKAPAAALATALAAALVLAACPSPTGPNTPPAPRYALAYDANGADAGSAPADASSYAAGEAVTAAGPGDLVKTGRYLAGWALSSTGTVLCAPGATFAMPSGGATLYAVWAPVTAGTGFAVVFGFADDDVLVLPGPLVVVRGSPLNLSVPGGFTDCEWRWDGDPTPFAGQSGPSASLDTAAAGILAGLHTLTVFADDAAGVRHSGSVQIRLEN
jgi:hypothetical protein